MIDSNKMTAGYIFIPMSLKKNRTENHMKYGRGQMQHGFEFSPVDALGVLAVRKHLER
jgi:hypothetical protein